MPPTSRGLFGPGKNAFRAREKYLILMVLATFAFICFGAIFFLPEKSSKELSSHNKVYRVYKGIQDVGRDLILPPPPPFDDAVDGVEINVKLNFHHGVIDKPDPHKVEDKAKLLAQVELDREIDEIRRRQQEQVLAKPNLNLPNNSNKEAKSIAKSSTASSTSKAFQKDFPPGEGPLVQGGEDSSVEDKRDKIKAMMKHAWDGYVTYGWGSNEVRPISLRGHSASVFGSASMGATIVDAMDTLYIMGMMDEFEKGKEWIDESLDFGKMTGDVSVFETNIRYVGGLLTLFAFTGDDMFRKKAVHIADKLLPAFKTPTGIPYALINFKTGNAKNFAWASGGSSILSEFGTLHMEFAYLSEVTGDPKYLKKVERIRQVIMEAKRPKKLYPNYLNPRTGKWGQQHTSVGALGDSFYEYLLKEWLRTGKKDRQAKTLFDEAATDIENELVKRSKGGLTYIAEYKNGRIEDKMDHLACFAGGMYGLAAHEEQDLNSLRWTNIAAGITNTCHESYDRTDSKLGPEAFRFTDAYEARSVKQNERYYILRPETFESYFIMWRLTHDQKYRDWGWEAVEAIEKHCKAPGGYTGIKNVYQVDSSKDDVQQSFFLAETLKYLYLLFSNDDLISLDQWVFNTEAHPLPIRGINSMHRGVKLKHQINEDKDKDPPPNADDTEGL